MNYILFRHAKDVFCWQGRRPVTGNTGAGIAAGIVVMYGIQCQPAGFEVLSCFRFVAECMHAVLLWAEYRKADWGWCAKVRPVSFSLTFIYF